MVEDLRAASVKEMTRAMRCRRDRQGAFADAVAELERLRAHPYFADQVQGLEIAISAVRRVEENDV